MTVKTPNTRPLWQRMLLRRLKFLLALVVLIVVVVGGSYAFAPQWLLEADNARLAMQAHVGAESVQVGDIRWSYYEGGEGPTIVLLHGFDSDKSEWLPVAKILTQHFHVVIPDLPGWGESSPVRDGQVGIDAQAARLQDFVQALGLRSFMLVGHSMGGAIAGVFAAEHPDEVNRLALVDAFGLKFKPNAFSEAALAGKDPFVYDDRTGFQRTLALALAHPPEVPGRIEDVFVNRNKARRAFIERSFAAMSQPSQYLALQNQLGALTMPVMGLWCHDDKIIDVSALDSLREGLKNASAISATTLHGCNHMPMMEKPDETARALTTFALSH